MGSGLFVVGMNKGWTEPGSLQGARYGLKSVCPGLNVGWTQPGSVQAPR